MNPERNIILIIGANGRIGDAAVARALRPAVREILVGRDASQKTLIGTTESRRER